MKIHNMLALHVTIRAYINDMVVSTWKYTICSLCMLRLIHDDYICTIAGYGTVYNNIPNCDCEHGISYYITWLDFDRFCWIWLFSFNCRWFLCMSAFQDEFGFELSQLHFKKLFSNYSICDFDKDLQPGLGSSTGIWIFTWDSDLLLGPTYL